MVCGLLLALVVGWNARSVLGFDFVAMDDDINIYLNPHLGPPNAPTLQWLATDTAYMRRYVPLGWLSFSIVYEFSGLSPAGYHAAGLLLHVVNTLLLFAGLRRLLRRWAPAQDRTWRTVCAMLGAAWWALHPYRAETVGWASGLLYATAGTFALIATLAYLEAWSAGPKRRPSWVTVSAVAYVASILTYPIGIGWLVVFGLIDVAEWRRPGDGRPTLRQLTWEKLRFVVPGLVVGVVTVEANVYASGFWEKAPSWREFGWLPRWAQACAAAVGYLWRRWWPIDLTPAPTRFLEVNPAEPIYGLSALALIAITAVLGARRTWRRGPLLWWLAFVALLAPVLGFTEHPYFAADRYDYFAGMVVSAAFVLLLVRLAQPWRAGGVVAATAVAAAFALGQQAQLRIWQNTDTLKERMIAASDNLPFRLTQYEKWAQFHADRGDRRRAEEIVGECARNCGDGPWLETMQKEIAEPSSEPAMHVEEALRFARQGRRREVREHLWLAHSIAPNFATASFNSAIFEAINGKLVAALRWYFDAITTSPAEVAPAARRRVLSILAEGFFDQGQPKLAVRAAELALREPGAPVETADLQRNLERYRVALKQLPGAQPDAANPAGS